MKGSLVLFIALLALVANNCKEESPTNLPLPPEPQRQVQLTLLDAHTQELWLQLSLPDTFSGRTVRLFRNNHLIKTFSVAGSDTLVLDSLLTPNQQYIYRVERVLDTVRLAVAELVCATLPITTRNFIWEVDTLGATMTHLYDVAVIHDSLIYVVGEIYLRDSLGQTDPTPYNLAIWNGQRWQLERVYWTFQGNQGVSLLTAIMAFSSNDIWVGDTVPYHWNGISWRAELGMVGIFASWINKIWGRSSSDLYIVGNNGNIAHYNGSSWRRVETGSTATLWDIWGINTEIYACGFRNSPPPAESILLKLTGDRVQALPLPPNFTPRALWFSNPHRLFIHNSRAGRTIVKRADSSWIQMSPHATQASITSLRGINANDIFGVGSRRIEHYDGETWATLNVGTIPDVFRACDYRSRTMCAVGSVGSFNTRGIVVRVRRP
jgi:hypothetical protein